MGEVEMDWWEADPWLSAAVGRGVDPEKADEARQVLFQLQKVEMRELRQQLEQQDLHIPVPELLRLDALDGLDLLERVHRKLWKARATLAGLDETTFEQLHETLRKAEKAVADDPSASTAARKRWTAAAGLSGVADPEVASAAAGHALDATGEPRSGVAWWFVVVAARARARGWPAEVVDAARLRYRRFLVLAEQARTAADDDGPAKATSEERRCAVALDHLFRLCWLALLKDMDPPSEREFARALASARRPRRARARERTVGRPPKGTRRVSVDLSQSREGGLQLGGCLVPGALAEWAGGELDVLARTLPSAATVEESADRISALERAGGPAVRHAAARARLALAEQADERKASGEFVLGLLARAVVELPPEDGLARRAVQLREVIDDGEGRDRP